MKIGIVDDGQGGSQAIHALTRRIRIQGVQFLRVLYADMQPKATAKQIARSAKSRLELHRSRGADQIVVLIDLEDRPECPGQFAGSLEEAFQGMGYSQVAVVAKNRKLENWLVADVHALKAMPTRFKISKAFEHKVSPDKADSVVDAEALLNSAAQGRPYHKRTDAKAIAQKQDALKVAKNSRSFRRFLRVLGHPAYSEQSAKP